MTVRGARRFHEDMAEQVATHTDLRRLEGSIVDFSDSAVEVLEHQHELLAAIVEKLAVMVGNQDANLTAKVKKAGEALEELKAAAIP